MEKARFVLVSIAVSTLVFHPGCHGSEHSLTFTVAAGVVDCFWRTCRKGIPVEMDYQVTDGGDLDIDFTLHAPDGRLLQSESRKSDGAATINPEENGDYKFCFDNTFSRMASKTVFLELVPDLGDDDDEDPDWKFDMEEVDGLMNMSLEEIKGVIDRSRAHLDKSIQIQTVIKMHEARDRHVLEANLSRVNIFSAFQVFVMLTVSLTQVLMIRNLFEEKGHGRLGFKLFT